MKNLREAFIKSQERGMRRAAQNELPTWKEIFDANAEKTDPLTYCIAFTPRSGSTWLGQVLYNSGRLGDPQEYFNFEAAEYAITHSGMTNIHDYFRYLKRESQTSGVFGFELAYPHLRKLFEEGLGEIVDGLDKWFFLRRRDFVAQAVSMYRAKTSGVYHSGQRTEKIPESPFDGDEIERLALALMAHEYRFSDFFDSRSLSVTNMWYEDLVEADETKIIELFTTELFPDGPPELPVNEAKILQKKAKLERVSDSHSSILVDRFKEENPGFLKYWSEHRGAKRIDQYRKEI